jgi:hypothetical protein
MLRLRTVVEALSVSTRIDAEGSQYRRLEQAYDALKWWLAHAPNSGEALDDVWWVCEQKGDRNANVPTLGAVYSFDDDKVFIAAILVRLPEL